MFYQRCSRGHSAFLVLVVFAIGPNANGIPAPQKPSATPKPTATPTPKPPPSPSDPDKDPTDNRPGGPLARVPNIAGAWRLDKSLSQGLSARLQGADEVKWTITQDDQTISIDQRVYGGEPPAAFPVGKAGGGGGRGPTSNGQSYIVNGKEAVSDVTFGKLMTKATMIGNTLELMRKTTVVDADGTERFSMTTQQLSLSDGGKTLTAKIHTESSAGGRPDSVLVFKKR